MISWRDLQRQVVQRANQRCEYCRMHQALQGASFHVEHIIPRSRGGASELENLAWACPSCNLRKSDRTESTSSIHNTIVPLFHPRIDDWATHFAWEGYRVVGLSVVGSATVEMLQLNEDRRLQIRKAEQLFELFPP